MTTITIDRATVEQALEALESVYGDSCDALHALRAALAQQAEPDHETRAELAEQQVVKLAEERDHYRNLWQQAQQTEPVQEPYCYVYEYDGVFGLHREFHPRPYNGMKPSRTVPVYTAPPQRKPLTEEEIIDAVRDADLDWAKGWTLDEMQGNRFATLARAIERAHGIVEGA